MDTPDLNLGEWDVVSSSLECEENEKNEGKENAPENIQADEEEMESEKDLQKDLSHDNSGDVREEMSGAAGVEDMSEQKISPHDESRKTDVTMGSVDVREDMSGAAGAEDMQEQKFSPHDESKKTEETMGSGDASEEIRWDGATGVEDLLLEELTPGDSSESDVDVIEESFDGGLSNPSINPTLDISMNSSGLKSTLMKRTPIVATTPEIGSPPVPVRHVAVARTLEEVRYHGRLHILNFIALILVGIMFICIGPPKNFKGIFSEMESRIVQLEAENKELKDHMLNKVDDDNLLTTMENQINALKDENNKLSVFMQDLIHELEHKTIVFKDGEAKSEMLQQSEIDKLKEQVNILRIDNDELQKQLVRMRYGVYSPRPTKDKASDEAEKKESMDEVNEPENATEILSEEIKDLREKLLSEVAKLTEWKKSVHMLLNGLENHPRESSTESPNPKGQKNKGNKVRKVFKQINDQFAEAVNNIPHFNLTDLVQKYMGVDKRKVKSVFDSVGHFFKKAQEKTKDIFDENIKSDMWNFIGSFRKQWHVLRKSYFEYSKKLQQYKSNKVFTPRFKGKNTAETYNKEKNDENIPKEEEMTYEETYTAFPAPEDFKHESHDQQKEVKTEKQAEAIISRNSWVFERAAHRSEIREEDQNEEDVNWFLKNKKASETPNYFSLDENDHESESYEPKDIFSMD